MNSREKGKRGEREAAKAWNDEGLPGDARRGQQFSGLEGRDVVVDPRLRLHLEVKRTEKLNLYEALTQAYEDADPLDVPIVLHRRNRKPWVAIVRLDYLAELARRIRG